MSEGGVIVLERLLLALERRGDVTYYRSGKEVTRSGKNTFDLKMFRMPWGRTGSQSIALGDLVALATDSQVGSFESVIGGENSFRAALLGKHRLLPYKLIAANLSLNDLMNREKAVRTAFSRYVSTKGLFRKLYINNKITVNDPPQEKFRKARPRISDPKMGHGADYELYTLYDPTVPGKSVAKIEYGQIKAHVGRTASKPIIQTDSGYSLMHDTHIAPVAILFRIAYFTYHPIGVRYGDSPNPKEDPAARKVRVATTRRLAMQSPISMRRSAVKGRLGKRRKDGTKPYLINKEQWYAIGRTDETYIPPHKRLLDIQLSAQGRIIGITYRSGALFELNVPVGVAYGATEKEAQEDMEERFVERIHKSPNKEAKKFTYWDRLGKRMIPAREFYRFKLAARGKPYFPLRESRFRFLNRYR